MSPGAFAQGTQVAGGRKPQPGEDSLAAILLSKVPDGGMRRPGHSPAGTAFTSEGFKLRDAVGTKPGFSQNKEGACFRRRNAKLQTAAFSWNLPDASLRTDLAFP